MHTSRFILAALVVTSAAWASELSTTPQPKVNGRIQERFKKSTEAEYPIIFMGDSITHGWEGAGKAVYQKYFGDKQILNIATSGDRTENTIWVIDNVDWKKTNPKVAMLMIGTNNTGHRKPDQEKPEDTIEGVKVILNKMAEKAPNTKILLLAIFPRGEKASDALRVRNNQVNAVLPTLCDGKRVFWMDINARFLEADGATMTRETMPDLLHPKDKGYTIWAEAVKAKLEELAK